MKFLKKIKGITRMHKVRKETNKKEVKMQIFACCGTKATKLVKNLQRLGENIPA